MHYKLIVNQPFQSTASVLAAAFRFVCAYDPHLLRLEEHYFTDGYANYRLLEDLPKSDLDDILEVFNDHYGADCGCVLV